MIPYLGNGTGARLARAEQACTTGRLPRQGEALVLRRVQRRLAVLAVVRFWVVGILFLFVMQVPAEQRAAIYMVSSPRILIRRDQASTRLVSCTSGQWPEFKIREIRLN